MLDSVVNNILRSDWIALLVVGAKRQAALRNHVPGSVWLLMLVSVTVCWTTGYATALGEAGRHALAMVILPILLTIVITLIADLDHPQRGLIKVSHRVWSTSRRPSKNISRPRSFESKLL
jgi:hypothetical protein